jgi:hypothetical protein
VRDQGSGFNVARLAILVAWFTLPFAAAVGKTGNRELARLERRIAGNASDLYRCGTKVGLA